MICLMSGSWEVSYRTARYLIIGSINCATDLEASPEKDLEPGKRAKRCEKTGSEAMRDGASQAVSIERVNYRGRQKESLEQGT